MFEKILLPLDGSTLAESAFSMGEEMAARLGSELILLHVCPPEQKAFCHMHELYVENVVSAMQSRIKKRFPKSPGANVRGEVITGEPAETICDYTGNHGIKMIIMATRGASGFKVWVLGSVADKIIRAVNIPTLLVRAEEDIEAGEKRIIKRILVPLDGSGSSESSLPYATALAKGLKASIFLFRMAAKVHDSYVADDMSGVDFKRRTAVAEKDARAYLLNIESKLREEGVPVAHKAALGWDAAQRVLEQENQSQSDLVVMATRGSSPVVRWVFGSVAEKVLREGHLPLLLIRA